MSRARQTARDAPRADSGLAGLAVAAFLLLNLSGLHAAQGAVDIQELRLAGGSTPGEGRVEARVNGTWGTLCAPSYLRANDDILTAVCSQLGYSSTTHALARSGRRALYADSKLQSVANLLECPPGAGSLRGCKVSAAGGDTCGAGELELYSALSVACNGSSVPAAVRLVDGRTTTQGRVEVQLAPGGPWGAVCGDPLENTANVVCRQLGFHASSYQEASLDVGAPTNTSSPLVADVLCARNESSLTECSFGAPDPMYCSSAAGGLTVACNEHTVTAARLVGGASPRQGVVEIQLDGGGPWAALCQAVRDGFTRQIAEVTCRMLGFGSGTDNHITEAGSSSQRPYWAGPYKAGHLECNGDEPYLAECPTWLPNTELRQGGCMDDEGGDSGWDLVNALCEGAVDIQELRLAGGSTPGEGRMEARVNGTWGTLCLGGQLPYRIDTGDEQGTTLLRAVCSQLGYANTTPALARGGTLYGDSELRPVAVMVECPPGAGGLNACAVAAAGDNEGCTRTLGVACNGSSVPAAVRLVGGRTAKQGRVEVQLAAGGPWGAACPGPFTSPDCVASVVCRQLGLPGGTVQEPGPSAGAGAGAAGSSLAFAAALQCAGNESSLAECSLADPSVCTDGGIDIKCREGGDGYGGRGGYGGGGGGGYGSRSGGYGGRGHR